MRVQAFEQIAEQHSVFELGCVTPKRARKFQMYESLFDTASEKGAIMQRTGSIREGGRQAATPHLPGSDAESEPSGIPRDTSQRAIWRSVALSGVSRCALLSSVSMRVQILSSCGQHSEGWLPAISIQSLQLWKIGILKYLLTAG